MSKTMSTMNKDEKRLMLFDMQEHPEKYTDEQVERLLADEEAQEFLRDLAMARMAGKKPRQRRWMWTRPGRSFRKSTIRLSLLATEQTLLTATECRLQPLSLASSSSLA